MVEERPATISQEAGSRAGVSKFIFPRPKREEESAVYSIRKVFGFRVSGLQKYVNNCVLRFWSMILSTGGVEVRFFWGSIKGTP